MRNDVFSTPLLIWWCKVSLHGVKFILFCAALGSGGGEVKGNPAVDRSRTGTKPKNEMDGKHCQHSLILTHHINMASWQFIRYTFLSDTHRNSQPTSLWPNISSAIE